ncbi:hypothetical protein A4X09_0g2370 [Tilletia walkeri]|uniref:phosphatidylinositol-3,4,5-trisphosphate 3-phosphatase n=1 Tax=Tilletia walkeri TaxID=117179 RepID=A0A8X7NCX1_9BASI|nr:hypothetical protein A4X09_0g2370 [Tilletia walkeri]
MLSVKRLVSGNKARFKDPDLKLELDLVYLTDQPNVILMGFPAQGLAAWYRNDRSEVLTFLESRHGDKFRIYNFVPTWENSYDADFFGGRVSRYPFPDHHAPPLSLISLFVTDIAHWLEGDPERAAAIHCKAGKGRTGTVAISYLLSLPYMPQGPSAINNLIRTSKKSKSKSKLSSTIDLHQSPSSDSSAPRSARKILIDTTAKDASSTSVQDGEDASPSPISVSSNSPATPLSTHSGPPDPEYLFALHTRQRMKPKFSDKDWVTQQLKRHSSAGSFAPSRASFVSQQESEAGSSSDQNGSTTANATSHHSPLAKQVLSANGEKATKNEENEPETEQGAPGFNPEAFDAVVQATADAAGPHATLPRFSKANSDNQSGPDPSGRGPQRSQSLAPSSTSTPDQDENSPRKFGVSIASQRRFVGYWFRILHGQDARAPLQAVDGWKGSPEWGSGLRGQRKARIVEVILHRDQPEKQSLSSKVFDDHIRIHLSRYDDVLVRKLEEEEWRVRTGPNAVIPGPKACETSNDGQDGEKEGSKSSLREDAVQRARNFDWGDANSESRYNTFAVLKRADKTDDNTSTSTASTRQLSMVPSDQSSSSLTVDPDREVLLTAFLSKAHTKLPHVASLASVWLVPAFENVVQDDEDVHGSGGEGIEKKRRFRTKFGKEDLDWRKGVSGIVGIEILWEV